MFFIDIEPDNKKCDIYKIRHIGNRHIRNRAAAKVKTYVSMLSMPRIWAHKNGLQQKIYLRKVLTKTPHF